MIIKKRLIAVAVAGVMTMSVHAGESVTLTKPVNFTNFSGLNSQLGVNNASSFKQVKSIHLKNVVFIKLRFSKTFGVFLFGAIL